MRKIPKKMLKEILEDPFYRKCCITGSKNVSLEHSIIYAGRQVNEIWAIVPLRRDLNTSHPPTEVKEKCTLIALSRATEEDFDKYPRAKERWKQKLKYLKQKYE